MWKKEDTKPQGVAETPVAPALSSHRDAPAPAFSPASSQPPASAKATACISQGIKIKGEITGSEDLFIDGPVEGKLNLGNSSVTIGPNGTVKADITAREVVVRGKVEGKIAGKERVQLWNTGQVNGEISTQRLAIEDGAILRGKVETGRPVDKTEDRNTVSAGKSNGATVPAGTTI
ncbi:MAG TPA: polymer-forming cytoskeletal protein [Candidatus Acidoferrum sp.]|jgi:cytoskeletal protein CcmA (bactofilin family)|nr:polymer-forming cytoskeletal protein [Candidatus Acidoferrum sp.]